MEAASIVEPCPSCGASIDEKFCSRCGELRPSTRVYTLREFFHEAFEVVTHIEHTFLGTLWKLVRRPGQLTAAYMRGERVPYARPLRLFLLVNVAFFLLGGVAVNVYSTPLNSHMYASPYGAQAQRIVTEQRARTGLSLDEYRRRFDARAAVLARTLVIVIAPMFAAFLALVMIRRGRPAVHHMVFALHFTTFVLLVTTVVALFIQAVTAAIRASGGTISEYAADQLAGVVMGIGVVAYLHPAYRRAYTDSRVSAAVKATVSFGALVVILMLYRAMLFYLTAYTL